MNDSIIATNRNIIGRALGKKEVLLRDHSIIIDKKEYPLSDLLFFARIKKGFLGYIIEINLNGQTVRLKFLQAGAINFLDILNKKIAKMLETAFNSYHKAYTSHVVEQYPRDSWACFIKETIDAMCYFSTQYASEVGTYFSETTKLICQNIIKFQSSNIKDLQEYHEKVQLEKRKDFFDHIESNPLTDEQRLAVLRSNDINLVLAAAGTGKTSVMVVKALDLIDRELAQPSEILIMAYNSSAANELEERLCEKAKNANMILPEQPEISTFHALGRKILLKSNKPTRLSVFSEDETMLKIWITDWLKKYLLTNKGSILDMMSFFTNEINPFNFKSDEEYQRYIRDSEYRTLQGEKVRGYQELLIANFLFSNNVKYKYEPLYVSKQRIEVGFDYTPDFQIVDTNIYIEHFGIDRVGNTRSGINSVQYNEEIRSKRKTHQDHNTTLVETFHYEWAEGVLLTNLEDKLKLHGIEFTPKTPEELYNKINNMGMISDWAAILHRCLQAIRTEQLDCNLILDRFRKVNYSKAKEISKLLDELHQAYLDTMKDENSIDFDEMIINSTNVINNGEYKPSWKYILVDEFQDISTSRMNLINALVQNGESASLTVVGDDWQAIYRFSGGKLELTTRFKELVGEHSLTMLQKTFRYNNSIADTAGKFVMENPEQYKKQIETHTKVESSQIFLYDDMDVCQDGAYRRVLEIIMDIQSKYPKESIAIIARQNYLLTNMKKYLSEKHIIGIKMWTFHKSKGLEADNCILMGLTQGKHGFPSENKDNIMVEALLPATADYEHSEERRLFYVGISRAKNRCYIVASAKAPSIFVSELLSPKYDISVMSKKFSASDRQIYKCPYCADGILCLTNSRQGAYYTCSSGYGCSVSKVRVCGKCNSPSIDDRDSSKCNNPKCKHTINICPRCGRELVKRFKGKRYFWGCTGFTDSRDQCKYTS